MQIYIAVVVTAVLALEVYRAVAFFAEDRKHLRKMQEARTDEAVDRAARVAEKEEKDRFNEGFENIMTYAVNGKNGFGEG